MERLTIAQAKELNPAEKFVCELITNQNFPRVDEGRFTLSIENGISIIIDHYFNGRIYSLFPFADTETKIKRLVKKFGFITNPKIVAASGKFFFVQEMTCNPLCEFNALLYKLTAPEYQISSIERFKNFQKETAQKWLNEM